MPRPFTLVALPLTAALALTACGGSGGGRDDTGASTSPVVTPSTPSAPSTSSATSAAPSTSSATRTSAAPETSAPPSPTKARHSAPATSAAAQPRAGVRTLPLGLDTGNATQAITVVSGSSGDTTATLQRWREDGSRWVKVGSAVDAYVGSDGIGKASENRSKTPAGSFTLTQAFGRDSDPGTRLPYLRTTPDDYWISSPGSKYNTEQRCGSCGYNNGTNERLYYVTPEYRHAVVIDYNTANAPGGVEQGKGSAFFLHVANGAPTAGCVAIPSSELVDVMTWLKPAAHPRILIGVD